VTQSLARILDGYGLTPAAAPRAVGGRVLHLSSARPPGDFALKIFAAAEAARARLEAALLAHLG
jgi:hypothetical protein